MNFMDNFAAKWQQLWQKAKPVMDKVKYFCQKVGEALRIFWVYVVKLRKALLAFPVAWATMILAIKNLVDLPEHVGLDLQSDGTFSILIAREIAVLGPIAITAFCLLLMFVSKKTLTPWLVSVISLLLPLVILITNTFPA